MKSKLNYFNIERFRKRFYFIFATIPDKNLILLKIE
jgi:hypothetical protein